MGYVAFLNRLGTGAAHATDSLFGSCGDGDIR